ncbi:unnamed protein product [Spirodela intermedia]|uniref:Uncharacterized protein n=1 Tax=Spirodela intermedia TaxID=51605 RepID=A0A7I8ILB9_SPIIN|nr:unnamed protein product [Spirodela intermedia]CAA6658602.1 unnamed protein product [Spirodela intermedia]
MASVFLFCPSLDLLPFALPSMSQ